MKLTYFKHLIIFIVATIIISLILFILNVGALILFIGLMILFAFACFSYFNTLKDISKDLGREFGINLKKFVPIIIFLAVSLPISIVMFVFEVSSTLMAIGLIILLVFLSVIYLIGMKMEIAQK